MTDCEFCHPENYCEYEGECKFRGKMRQCKAKSEDLIEICQDCNKPISECDCGTNWVLLDVHKKIVAITPKKYAELTQSEEGEK